MRAYSCHSLLMRVVHVRQSTATHLKMRLASTALSKQSAIFLIANFSLVSRLRAELQEG